MLFLWLNDCRTFSFWILLELFSARHLSQAKNCSKVDKCNLERKFIGGADKKLIPPWMHLPWLQLHSRLEFGPMTKLKLAIRGSDFYLLLPLDPLIRKIVQNKKIPSQFIVRGIFRIRLWMSSLEVLRYFWVWSIDPVSILWQGSFRSKNLLNKCRIL